MVLLFSMQIMILLLLMDLITIVQVKEDTKQGGIYLIEFSNMQIFF